MVSEVAYPRVTLLYAGIMGLFYLAISLYVVRQRTQKKIGLGHDNDPSSPLFRAVRIHANFSEFVPFILFLFLLDEMTGRNPLVLHALGFSLLIARCAHYAGIKKTDRSSPERLIGMAVTMICLVVPSALLILKGLR